jgi:hypothetical protein
MVANVRFDRQTNTPVYNIEDPTCRILTAGADVDKASEVDPTQKVASSPPPDAEPDGDAETPDGPGTPAVDLLLANRAGDGPTERSIPPAPSESGRGSSHWIWIGVGAIAISFLGARWGGKKSARRCDKLL